MLLKDRLNDILLDYDMNINPKGEDILKKRARDERIINYNNLLFRTGNPNIGNCNFLKRFGTFYDLLINLFNEEISSKKAAIEQDVLLDKIDVLENFISLEQEILKKKLLKVL